MFWTRSPNFPELKSVVYGGKGGGTATIYLHLAWVWFLRIVASCKLQASCQMSCIKYQSSNGCQNASIMSLSIPSPLFFSFNDSLLGAFFSTKLACEMKIHPLPLTAAQVTNLGREAASSLLRIVSRACACGGCTAGLTGCGTTRSGTSAPT